MHLIPPEGTGQVMIITASMRIGCGKFGVAQGPDQGNDPTQKPDEEKHSGSFRIGGNKRRRFKDTRTDYYTNDKSHSVNYGKGLPWHANLFLHSITSPALFFLPRCDNNPYIPARFRYSSHLASTAL